MQPAKQRTTTKSSSKLTKEEREAKKEALRKRKEEREAKENERALKIFGLPIAKEKVILDLGTKYGFAYINRENRWSYRDGYFPFLYGFYAGLDFMSESFDEDEGNFNSAFFLLDDEGFPISIIKHIRVPAHIAPLINHGGGSEPHDVELRDLLRVEKEDVPQFDARRV